MRLGAAMLLSAAMACGSHHDSEPAAATTAARPGERPPAKETRVFEVKSSADLVNLRAEYMNLWESGFDGQFEVRFAVAPYTAAGWDLAPAPDSKKKSAPPTIDVVLRGDSSAPPPPARVVARSLELDGLVLKLQYGTSELAVRDRLTMKGCLVVEGRGLEFSQKLFSVLGVGDHGSTKTRPVSVAISDSWFVRNFQGPQAAPMLHFGSVEGAPTYFDSIAIERSAFLGNAFASELDVHFAREMKISDSLFYKTWPDGVLIASTSSGEILVDRSVIIVEDTAHIARHGAESPAIRLAASTRVYAKSGAKPPEGIAAEPGQFKGRASIADAEDRIAEAVKMPASVIPGPDLKQKLDAALKD